MLTVYQNNILYCANFVTEEEEEQFEELKEDELLESIETVE